MILQTDFSTSHVLLLIPSICVLGLYTYWELPIYKYYKYHLSSCSTPWFCLHSHAVNTQDFYSELSPLPLFKLPVKASSNLRTLYH